MEQFNAPTEYYSAGHMKVNHLHTTLYVRGPFVDWRQCAAVMQREAVGET
jgi:hypothetical protein